MEYLQYIVFGCPYKLANLKCFKPYYKWNTFNTVCIMISFIPCRRVLNLIINGIPSILWKRVKSTVISLLCFKPYYKWNTFNTMKEVLNMRTKQEF